LEQHAADGGRTIYVKLWNQFVRCHILLLRELCNCAKNQR
jgi:hypothetical protein